MHSGITHDNDLGSGRLFLRRRARRRRIKRIVLDSSVYGAMIEDEERYSPDSERFWDITFSKALFRLREKISFYGCLPIEGELKEAP